MAVMKIPFLAMADEATKAEAIAAMNGNMKNMSGLGQKTIDGVVFSVMGFKATTNSFATYHGAAGDHIYMITATYKSGNVLSNLELQSIISSFRLLSASTPTSTSTSTQGDESNPRMSEIIFYLVEFLFHSALLMAVLWIMIKFQDFDYTFLGLLGTAVAGGALDMIPFVGHALAVATLYICITKMTRASMFPDAAFTVAVGYALMFAVKVLAFTAIIGDLRPSAMDRKDSEAGEPPALLQSAETGTGQPATSSKAAPTTANSKAAAEFVQKLTIKGVTWNGNNSSVTIQYGGKSHLVFAGETVLLPAGEKSVWLKVEKVENQTLTFSVNGELATCTYK